MRIIPLLLFLGTLLGSAQEMMMRLSPNGDTTDTHVAISSLFSLPSADGYFPVRVTISNNRQTPAFVRVNFTSTAGWDARLASSSSFDFTAAPGTTLTRDILVPQQPVSTSFGNSTTIKTEVSGTLGSGNHTVAAGYEPGQPSVLMSEPLFTKNGLFLDTAMSASGASGHYGSAKFASKCTAADLPDNWLAYSGFDHLFLLDSDWTSMPAGARSAILSWVRLGGRLHVHSTGTPSLASLGIPADLGYGSVRTAVVPADFLLDQTEVLKQAGIGTTPNRKFSLENEYHSSWPLRAEFGDESFQYAIFIVILVIFGILVGPVNLFVFAKSGRRHRLFITTPLIALGASVLLVLLIIFQDGFGGRGRRTVLMEVADNSAHVRQEQFCRTGVLTRTGFTVDAPVLITPVQVKETPWARYTTSEQKGTFNIQPAGAKTDVSGDWFQSRSEQGHAIDTIVPTRGRIESAGGGKLVSTFEFPIKTLFFLDEAGDWKRAENITTGQPFELTAVNGPMAIAEMDVMGSKLVARSQSFFNKARQRNGGFVALTDAAPAIETLSGIRWEKTTTFITGLVAKP